MVQVYIIVNSLRQFVDVRDRIDAIAAHMFDALGGLFAPLGAVAQLWQWAVDVFQSIQLTVPIAAEVTCQGAQAPFFLLLNFAVVLVLVVLFDSHLFV